MMTRIVGSRLEVRRDGYKRNFEKREDFVASAGNVPGGGKLSAIVAG